MSWGLLTEAYAEILSQELIEMYQGKEEKEDA